MEKNLKYWMEKKKIRRKSILQIEIIVNFETKINF